MPINDNLIRAILESFPLNDPCGWVCKRDISDQLESKGFGREETSKALFHLRSDENRQLECGGTRDVVFRLIGNYPPHVFASELPYLIRGWDILTDEWQRIKPSKITAAFSTPKGYNYFMTFRNRGIVEEELRDDGKRRYRRGKNIVTLYPRNRHLEDGELIDINKLIK